MSGTGKSTLIVELRALGYKAIDTGWDPEWEEPDRGPDAGSGWVWREDRIEALLSTEDAQVLFVGACVPNQGQVLSAFRCGRASDRPGSRDRGTATESDQQPLRKKR